MMHRWRRGDGTPRTLSATERVSNPHSFPSAPVPTTLRLPFLVLALIVHPVQVLLAQLEPPSTGGAAALAHEARMVGHVKRVLVIGAHPDDEDTDLLTVLVRGMGAEAAYL